MRTSAQAIRVFVVDDHPVLRRGVRNLLEGTAGLSVCGEAGGVQTALESLPAAEPDVALVELALAEGSGLGLIREIRKRWEAVRVLVLSMHEEWLYAERCLAAGASGFVNKAEPEPVLVDAIRSVHAGEVHLSEKMRLRLGREAPRTPRAEEADPLERLSSRELEVLRLLGEGHGTREIARELGVSVKTLETHRGNIKEKLGLRSAPELVAYAVRRRAERV